MKNQLRFLSVLLLAAASAGAQFSSGSNGSDGALNYTTAGTYVFDPAALGLNAAADNIFNFTTINIASGVTLQLRSSKLRAKPVIWLASGAVTIAGTLDASGADGLTINPANPWSTQIPSDPGPGGFQGGLGGEFFLGLTSYATAGLGPGAPTPPTAAYNGTNNNWGCGASAATPGTNGDNVCTLGALYGTPSLNPLIGGSGGNGAGSNAGSGGGNGGAGGGVIRIISSVSIQITGSILARGGAPGVPNIVTSGGYGGGGSGGVIHLIAPTISGAGGLDTSGGPRTNGGGTGGKGRILLSANTLSFSGTQTGLFFSGPLSIPAPLPWSSVTITSVNSVAVPANPSGNLAIADITITATTAVTVGIAASNVPIGTVVSLTLLPEMGTPVTVSCSPLAGSSVASTTATCSATFASGTSLLTAFASW